MASKAKLARFAHAPSAAASAPAAIPAPAPSAASSKRRAVEIAYDSSSGAAEGVLERAVASFEHSLVRHGAASSSSSSAPVEAVPGSPARGFGARAAPAAEWRAQLANIVQMRRSRDAPVDSMGCERCADPSSPPKDQRFQTLVSLMLSSQTKDPVTFAATKALIAGGLGSAAAMAAASEATIDGHIAKVGFHNNKARFLKLAGAHCVAKCGGDIPSSVEGLVELKGVGPKMAFLAMHAAWGKAVGIGVDTHVHRISNRLGWVKTTTPEATRDSLQAMLARDFWGGINIALVGFGQQICTPLSPSCALCLNRNICPSSSAKDKKARVEPSDGAGAP